MTAASGLVIVAKPAGMTSHDVVARIRRLAGTRRVGHAGTLDPMATGVLVVGVEKATRLLGHLTLADKDYLATIRLGQATEPAWREALDRTELRCYAKPHLAKLAGLDPESADLPAEFQSERADLAWLIADMFGPFSQLDFGKERFPFDFGDLQQVSGFEKPDEVFEAVARLDHPDAEAVLAMIAR